MRKISLVMLVLILLAVYYTQEPVNLEEAQISAYFCPRDNCNEVFAKELFKANESISCALYDTSEDFLETIASARVPARIVFEKDNIHQNIPDRIVWYNDTNSALMHNKFCIIDEEIVVTGSTNPTENGFIYNNNNLIVVKSRPVAEVFQYEFEELIGEETKDIQYYKWKELEVFFCPENKCADRLIKRIRNSKTSIDFATFSFTDPAIATELIAASKRGVKVSGVMEKRGGAPLYDALDPHIEVSYDMNPKTMHHKFFVFDNKTVWTGSYNPTGNGNTRNDENVIVIEKTEIATKFLEEFELISSLS